MRWVLRVLSGVALVSATFGGAQAAPQVLGLIATNDAVPLTCRHGECAAEFTAICLQPDRASPAPGKVYEAAGGEGVTVVAETTDGRQMTLPAEGLVTYTALRGHNAVRLSIPGRRLNQLGIKRAALKVGKLVSLIPTPMVGDTRPQSVAEIELATGPFRQLAAKLVDSGGIQLETARVTRDVLNGLPWRGRSTAEERHAAWQRALGAKAAQASTDALARAERAFRDCEEVSATGVLTMRACLGSKHDSMIGMLNNEYWDALNAGS